MRTVTILFSALALAACGSSGGGRPTPHLDGGGGGGDMSMQQGNPDLTMTGGGTLPCASPTQGAPSVLECYFNANNMMGCTPGDAACMACDAMAKTMQYATDAETYYSCVIQAANSTCSTQCGSSGNMTDCGTCIKGDCTSGTCTGGACSSQANACFADT